MPKDTILLAYSGGLDTSVCVKWLQEKHDANVVTLTVDLGMVEMEPIRQRALQTGAVDALTVDGREEFVKNYVFPALQAGAVYEEQYPLATALGRPLIAKYMVEAAHRVGAIAIAHGCTGKGNDQVRMDVSAGALDPNVKVIAPVREWGWNREEELEYAAAHDITIPTSNSRFSTDENLWGRSVEAGELEDPWAEPPEDAYLWTKPVGKTPDSPTYVEIAFEGGIPNLIDGEEMGSVELVEHLNDLAGRNGVGRIDHVENRLVGIKSREIYESPAGVVLHAAHKALESLTLSKDQARMKNTVAQEYSDVVYNASGSPPTAATSPPTLRAPRDTSQAPSVCGFTRATAPSWAARPLGDSTATSSPLTTGETSSTTAPPKASSPSTAFPSAPKPPNNPKTPNPRRRHHQPIVGAGFKPALPPVVAVPFSELHAILSAAKRSRRISLW